MNLKLLTPCVLATVVVGCTSSQVDVSEGVKKGVAYTSGAPTGDSQSTPTVENAPSGSHTSPPEPAPDVHSKLFTWASTRADGLTLAKKMKNGRVLLKFEASWCAPCQTMKREAFQDAEIAKTLKNVVVVPIDVETEMGQGLAVEYESNELPNMVFLDQKGDIIGRLKGYANVQWLDGEFKKILTPKG